MKSFDNFRRHIPALFATLLPLCLCAQGLHTGPGTQVVISGAPTIVLSDAAIINDGTLAAGNSLFVLTGNTGRPSR